MSSANVKDSPPPARPEAANGNELGPLLKPPPVAGIRQSYGDRRLRINPNKNHKSEKYDDLKSEFDPSIFSSLEKHLPPSLLEMERDAKIQYMNEILGRYLPEGERAWTQKVKNYRQPILKHYQPLHKELYNMDAATFFVPSFIKAISENTEENFRSIMSEPSPGIYTFAMLQPSFCEQLIAEVENFENWANALTFKTMRPSTMHKYGHVLDDFGLEAMLNKLMVEFICPISRVFFPEVGGSTLDSHHGFVVEYGNDKQVGLDFHIDSSEVTLNACLGKEFSGGELFFQGTRCDEHMNSIIQPEETATVSHIPGQAVLHCGYHRHAARPTTSGRRINLHMWCQSSVFREMKRYQKDFSGWCDECRRQKKERQRQSVAATKAILKREGGSGT